MSLQQGGNELVNRKYLAKYNSTEVRGGIRMPSSNSDLNALRSWIQYKYVDKIWYGCDGSGSNNSSGAPEAPVEVQTAPPGRRKIINDVSTQLQPQEDLFGGGWDAFGETPASPAPAAHDATDFDTVAVSSPKASNNASFHADFGNQQPTAVHIPQQEPFETNFDQPQFKTIFDQPQQFNPVNHNQRQNQQQQPSFHADFDQLIRTQRPDFDSNLMNGQLQQQIEPSFEANFDHVQNLATDGFGNFITNQSNTKNNLIDQQHSFCNSDQKNMQPYANFNQTSTQLNQTAIVQAQYTQPQLTMPTVTMSLSANNANVQSQGVSNNFGSFNQAGVQSVQPNQGLSNIGKSDQAAPDGPQMIAAVSGPDMSASNEAEQVHTYPTAFTSTAIDSIGLRDADKKSAFDAFDGLSLGPSLGLTEKSWADDAAATLGGPPPPVHGDSNDTSANTTAKLQETTMMLQNLSLEQLLQVQEFIFSLFSPDNYNSLADSATETKRMTEAVPKLHMSNECSVGHNLHVGEIPVSTQMPSIGMGSNMAANPEKNMMNVNQKSMETGSTMRSNVSSIPAIKIGSPSFNDQVQASDDVVEAPKANLGNLPPVEKEGNPFDMY